MAPVLLFKLVVTPILIGALSLAARRWGHAVGGWLVGLPLTSGPISVFLTLEHGPGFAQATAASMVSGTIGVAMFAVVYSRACTRLGWMGSAVMSLAAFFLVLPAAGILEIGIVAAFLAAAFVHVAAVLALARPSAAARSGFLVWWDIPARMVAATTLVVVITAIASELGPSWTGVLSPFPVFSLVLAVFTHRHSGPEGVIRLMRGLAFGLFSFISFFLVVGLLLLRVGAATTYSLAAIAALAVSGLTWVLDKRMRRSLPVVSE